MLTEADVRQLLALRTENRNLDYKQRLNWATATADAKGGVIKDVLAMANTQDGGKILFGVRDNDFEVVGVTEEEFNAFDATRFADFLNRYADPQFGCGLHKFIMDGHRIVAIEVPEFRDVPIICKADLNDANNRPVLRRGAAYIRTDRAASEAVSTSEVMRELMNRAAARRGDEILKMVERLIKGRPARENEAAGDEIRAEVDATTQFLVQHLPERFTQVGRWELNCYVLPYLRERIVSLATISELVAPSQVTLLGWYFPHLDREHQANFQDGVQSFTVGVREHLEGYRSYRSGTFAWRGSYWEDVAPQFQAVGQRVLSYVGVIFQITEFFLFARRFYERVAPDATVHLTLRMTDALDRQLASFQEPWDVGGYFCRIENVEVDTQCTVAELVASYDELARNAIRKVFELFNWNNSSEEMIRTWQERLLNRRF